MVLKIYQRLVIKSTTPVLYVRKFHVTKMHVTGLLLLNSLFILIGEVSLLTLLVSHFDPYLFCNNLFSITIKRSPLFRLEFSP